MCTRPRSQVLSAELLPGDVMSVVHGTRPRGGGRGGTGGGGGGAGGGGASKPDGWVPADAVLVSGGCVVNEAMLTGESVPQVWRAARVGVGGGSDCMCVCSLLPSGGVAQVKEALPRAADAVDGDGVGALALDRHVRHIVSCGTRVLTSGDESAAAGAAHRGAGQPPPPPDGGCLAFVLRTGFHSAQVCPAAARGGPVASSAAGSSVVQGGLMRTIAFSTERASAGTAEAFKFILMLLCFAVRAPGAACPVVATGT